MNNEAQKGPETIHDWYLQGFKEGVAEGEQRMYDHVKKQYIRPLIAVSLTGWMVAATVLYLWFG